MKNLLIILLFIALNGIGQEVRVLHPTLNDTITLDDKLDYSLFPKVENESLDYSIIMFSKDKYYLKSYYLKVDSVSEVLLTKNEIIEAQENIDKINAYYLRKQEKRQEQKMDSAQNANFSQMDLLELEVPEEDRVSKEARMQKRITEGNERLEQFEKGLTPQRLTIDFK